LERKTTLQNSASNGKDPKATPEAWVDKGLPALATQKRRLAGDAK